VVVVAYGLCFCQSSPALVRATVTLLCLNNRVSFVPCPYSVSTSSGCWRQLVPDRNSIDTHRSRFEIDTCRTSLCRAVGPYIPYGTADCSLLTPRPSPALTPSPCKTRRRHFVPFVPAVLCLDLRGDRNAQTPSVRFVAISSWNCCTTSYATSPHQIDPMGFEHERFLLSIS